MLGAILAAVAFFAGAFFTATFLGAFVTVDFLTLAVFLAADRVFCLAGFLAFLAFLAVEVAFADPFLTAITFSFINVNLISSLLYCDEPPTEPRNHL
ncbi:hypothetical protein NYF23_06245 [SAR92 clade bacterium H455]|uniref:Uncharacterized protein n=1 Tax=SAR92 clade bacterium H455 TaxID=2974818 RepID=A0ABY5TUW5_9GAMM|nr:hypothetical protein NYF23_06245 [SAR92 clade bacterium H455]